MTGSTPRRGLMVISHGRDSGPDARKAQFLKPMAAEHGWRTEVPDYRGLEPAQRIAMLVEMIRATDEPVALAGSSLGGVVSVAAAQQRPVEGLFLMAPAVYHPGYEALDHRVRTGIIHVLHGWRDEVIAPERVIRFAREHRATLHLIDDDHRLTGRMLEIERLFEDFLEQLETAGSDHA